MSSFWCDSYFIRAEHIWVSSRISDAIPISLGPNTYESAVGWATLGKYIVIRIIGVTDTFFIRKIEKSKIK